MPRKMNCTECQGCHAPAGPDRPLSRRGLCVDCAARRMEDNAIGLRAHAGPAWDRFILATTGVAPVKCTDPFRVKRMHRG